MEKRNETIIKITIVVIILGICVIYLLYGSHGEGDPFFVFYEVPVNATINSTVILLEDKDLMDIQGLDVKQKNGRIDRIYFRYSDTTPAISYMDFYEKYGSHTSNVSLRKYLEYKGIYYYARLQIP